MDAQDAQDVQDVQDAASDPAEAVTTRCWTWRNLPEESEKGENGGKLVWKCFIFEQVKREFLKTSEEEKTGVQEVSEIQGGRSGRSDPFARFTSFACSLTFR